MIFLEKITNRHMFTDNETYPFNIPAINGLKELHFRKDVTFLIGDNGTGKSTLIEAIAVNAGFNPEGGTKNFNFSTANTHSKLYEEILLTRGGNREKDGFFIRAESFYNVATAVDELLVANYYGGSLHTRSHGESFLAIFNHRMGGNGLYILDEPESALSINSLLAMMIKMKELVDRNSQFIIATHSPILMAYPGADIIQITDSGLERVEYENTEQYAVTRYFLSNYRKVLEGLFNE